MSRFTPRIVFGSLDLTADPYSVGVEFDLDAGSTIYDVVSSLVLDGSIVTSPGVGNRETISLPILIDWPDSHIAARRAEALEVELAKPFNTLTFYPGDGAGPVTVLETFEGQIALDSDPGQIMEQDRFRRYILTIPALPFARAKDPVQITWTGPGRELDPLTSLSAWTTSPTPTLTNNPTSGSPNPSFEMAATTTLSRQILADNYLWIQVQGPTGTTSTTLHDVTVNGEAISASTIRYVSSSSSGFYTIPTERWQGQTVTVSFQIDGTGGSHKFLVAFWSLAYPNVGWITTATVSKPKGLDVIDVLGSARTPCTIRFTAPSGGAFVYTAPDPNAQLRQRGAGEIVFAKFTVSSSSGAEVNVGGYLTYFPQGTHYAQIGMTDAQPLELNPNGVYPANEMKTFTATGITSTFQYPYPTDTRAAISFFSSTGAKALITPSASLPQGYHGDTVAGTSLHALHPPRCGFGVFDTSGNPITTTIDYYPRNRIHAAH